MNRPSIILLQPPGACRLFTRSGSVYPPLGLAQVAASAPEGAVRVLDADGEGWTDDETVAALRVTAAPLLGLSATSYTLDLVETWASYAKDLGMRVVVGGPHATLKPMDVLRRCPSVDAVVRGEGELIIEKLIECATARLSFDELAGVATRSSTEEPVLLRVADLSDLPFPSFDQLPVNSYWCPDARRRPMVTMATTRGCPHRCAFCSSPTLLGKSVRAVPISRVVEELEHLVNEHGVREISFVDDVFTLPPKRALALCKAITARKLDITWFCNARADQIWPELAHAMAAAGCHQVYLGFESGDQQMLDRINKGTTLEKLENGAQLLAEVGIERSVGFVIGLPGESDATVRASIDFAHRIKPERVQFTRFTPLVGSPLEGFDVEGGFHNRQDDQVGRWIAQCYRETGGHNWGRESV